MITSSQTVNAPTIVALNRILSSATTIRYFVSYLIREEIQAVRNTEQSP
jgi:hypothetical protein